jgi:hypothetical protein
VQQQQQQAPEPDRGQLAVGDGYDVAVPDLTVYGDGCGCTGQQVAP